MDDGDAYFLGAAATPDGKIAITIVSDNSDKLMWSAASVL